MSGSASRPVGTDGATQTDPFTRKASRSPPRDDICCVFVHAGAGYHSLQNERIHLEACNDAAQVAMLILRNGGSAVDAVEMAVKILEDREITNAGYGSNLAMDGVVECDASIVDHYGRSGAVGAVAQIKNPISLARLVLKHTMQSLTLRRVPPNLLVSQGATDFAYEMGVPILPFDALISPAAKDRWIRWKADLKTAERKAKKSGLPPSYWRIQQGAPDDAQVRQQMREDHGKALLQKTSYLPQAALSEPSNDPTFYAVHQGSSSTSTASDPSVSLSEGSVASWPTEHRSPTPESCPSEDSSEPPVATPYTTSESSRSAFINSTQKVPTIGNPAPYRALRDISGDSLSEHTEPNDVEAIKQGQGSRHSSGRGSWGDGSEDSDTASSAKTERQPAPSPTTATAIGIPLPNTPTEKQFDYPTPRGPTPLSHVNENAPLPPALTRASASSTTRDDHITDTVGAIAVDSFGNIACGASSGGIGMKYRGRVGPAALVGVGAAVVPVNPSDPDQCCVATVTSGTGEHMATTMAATVCAERLYHSNRKGKAGVYEDVTEDEALKAMIENEFMGHPSVKNSNSAGAIGILGIKKVRNGVFFYFGHNTDSFAMASMHSDEEKPWCAMSRSNGNGQIAQGGRMLRYRMKKPKRTNTPGR